MSSGTTLSITMVGAKPHHISQKTLEVLEEKQPLELLSDKKCALPNYFYHKAGYVEKATRKILPVIAEVSFTSSFMLLREHYNMDPYKAEYSTRDITEDAPAWRQACEYILRGSYSRDMEELLDNEYIRVLRGSGYYFKGGKYERDEEYMWEDLQRFTEVLRSFSWLNRQDLADSYCGPENRKYYKLICTIW